MGDVLTDLMDGTEPTERQTGVRGPARVRRLAGFARADDNACMLFSATHVCKSQDIVMHTTTMNT